jgi:hypothetical protein
MSVNRKIFGLASSVLAFAGMAYGQALTCTAQPTSPTNPIELRSEGTTELVSDTVTNCAASGVALGINGNVTAFISGSGVQAITSKSIGGGVTEATLAIIPQVAGPDTFYYAGTVTGAQVTFGSTTVPVNFPNYAFIIQVSNVRVNVSGTYPSVPQAVTETVFAGTQGVASLFTPTATTVGYIRNGLAVNGNATIYQGAGSSTAGTAGSITTFQVCAGQTDANAFQVTVSELFAGAFKTQTAAATGVAPYGLTPASANIPGAEAGSFIGTGVVQALYPAGQYTPGTTVGTANSGTRIKFVFNNIPANATLSVPPTILGNAAALAPGGVAGQYNLQMSLTSGSETGAFSQAVATANNGGLVALTASGGSATAIYEVTQANLTVIKFFVLQASVTYTANAVIAPAGPITVTTSYSPSPATPGAAIPSPIPTIPYFANTGTVLNGSTFTACSTTLVFPFVTNESSFETGIAIANTGLDYLNPTGKTTSVATGQSGACTISFFGSTGAEGGTQPALPTAANFPASTKTPATIAPGTTHADTLTDIIGGPFQGYAIANCPFLYAKGFAFIEYGLATSNGVVEGYLADVITSTRQSSVAALANVGSAAPESSGQ